MRKRKKKKRKKGKKGRRGYLYSFSLTGRQNYCFSCPFLIHHYFISLSLPILFVFVLRSDYLLSHHKTVCLLFGYGRPDVTGVSDWAEKKQKKKKNRRRLHHCCAPELNSNGLVFFFFFSCLFLLFLFCFSKHIIV